MADDNQANQNSGVPEQTAQPLPAPAPAQYDPSDWQDVPNTSRALAAPTISAHTASSDYNPADWQDVPGSAVPIQPVPTILTAQQPTDQKSIWQRFKDWVGQQEQDNSAVATYGPQAAGLDFNPGGFGTGVAKEALSGVSNVAHAVNETFNPTAPYTTDPENKITRGVRQVIPAQQPSKYRLPEMTAQEKELHGLAENLGAGTEDILEFFAGSEALKALSGPAKLQKMKWLADAMEKYPKFNLLLQAGISTLRSGIAGAAQAKLHSRDATTAGLTTGAFAAPFDAIGAALDVPDLSTGLKNLLKLTNAGGQTGVVAKGLYDALSPRQDDESPEQYDQRRAQGFILMGMGSHGIYHAAAPGARAAKDFAFGAVKAVVPKSLFPSEAEAALHQAIQPGVNIPKAKESIRIVGPRLQQMKSAGEIIDPETDESITKIENLRDVVVATQAAQKKIWAQIDAAVSLAGQKSYDVSRIGDAIRDSIEERTRRQYPEIAKSIEQRASSFDEPMTLQQLNANITAANRELRSYYKRAMPGEAGTTPSVEATLAEVTQSRRLLDQYIQNLSGEGIADLKREWGAARDVERAAVRQANVRGRLKGAGLYDALAVLSAVGDIVKGGPLGALKAAGTLGVSQYLKSLRDPNLLIKGAFEGRITQKPFTQAGPFPVLQNLAEPSPFTSDGGATSVEETRPARTVDQSDIPLPNRGGVIRRQPFATTSRGLALPAAPEPAGLLPEQGGLSAERPAPIIRTRTQPRPIEVGPSDQTDNWGRTLPPITMPPVPPHLLENTELHAKLATYYKEPFGLTSIEELENRFVNEINLTKQRRLPLDQRQIELLDEINVAWAAVSRQIGHDDR